MVDMLGCRGCGRWFPNLDNTMVCPNCGNECDGDTDEDDDHIPARGRRMSAEGVDNILAAADKIAANARVIDEVRTLHRVVTAPGGIRFCEHCCLNKVAERRFSCHGNHTHRLGTAPCPTLAILGDPA